MSKPLLSLASHFLSFITTEIGQNWRDMASDNTRACYPRISYYFQLEKGSHRLLWTHTHTHPQRYMQTLACRAEILADWQNCLVERVIAPNKRSIISNKWRFHLYWFNGVIRQSVRMRILSFFRMLNKKARNPIQTFSVSAEALWWLTTELVKRRWGVNGC